jgi:hypothetical protein
LETGLWEPTKGCDLVAAIACLRAFYNDLY